MCTSRSSQRLATAGKSTFQYFQSLLCCVFMMQVTPSARAQRVGGVHVSTRGHRSGCPPHRSCIHQPVCARWAPTCVFEVVHVRRRLRLRAHDDVLVHVVVVCAVRGATQLRNPDVCQPRNDEAPCSEVVVPASPLPRCCFSQVERAQRWLRGRE
jgi:hypothetical protein